MAIALSPGANCPLPATARIAVSVRTSAAHADVVALLLDGNGHADGDDGVVLFSHPVTAAGAVVLTGDTVTIELAKLPGAVQRVLVVAQADGVTDMTACGATTAVVSGDGTEAARFELPAPPAMPTVQLVDNPPATARGRRGRSATATRPGSRACWRCTVSR